VLTCSAYSASRVLTTVHTLQIRVLALIFMFAANTLDDDITDLQVQFPEVNRQEIFEYMILVESLADRVDIVRRQLQRQRQQLLQQTVFDLTMPGSLVDNVEYQVASVLAVIPGVSSEDVRRELKSLPDRGGQDPVEVVINRLLQTHQTNHQGQC